MITRPPSMGTMAGEPPACWSVDVPSECSRALRGCLAVFLCVLLGLDGDFLATIDHPPSSPKPYPAGLHHPPEQKGIPHCTTQGCSCLMITDTGLRIPPPHHSRESPTHGPNRGVRPVFCVSLFPVKADLSSCKSRQVGLPSHSHGQACRRNDKKGK